MASAITIPIGGRDIRLSNPDKLLYPDAGFTKADVLDYYVRIAPVLLPHVQNRPLSLRRFPSGHAGEAFFEKNCPSHKPAWVKTARLPGASRVINLCLADSPAALAWLANLAALELHAYLWTTRAPQTPTLMVFDLDPGPGVELHDCCEIALRLEKLLGRLGLEGLPKTSGGKGLHLMVPLNTPRVTFDETKPLARALATALERDDPDRVTSNMNKAQRPGRVFIDWSQNDRHKTTVSVYSLRGRARPTVSTPLTWAEVRTAARKRDASRLVFEAPQVLARVKRRGDLAAALLTTRQTLPDPQEQAP